MDARAARIRRTGLSLVGLLVGLVIYSFLVIRYRAKLPEPPNLTKWQRIFRGL